MNMNDHIRETQRPHCGGVIVRWEAYDGTVQYGVDTWIGDLGELPARRAEAVEALRTSLAADGIDVASLKKLPPMA